MLDYRTLGCHHVFGSSGKKMFPLYTGVLLQEKAKLLYEHLFPDATVPFAACTGFRTRFITELAERTHAHCITV